MLKSSPQSEQSPPDMWTCFEHLSSLRHPLCFCRIIAESCQNQLFQSLDAKSAKETWWLGPGLCGDLLRLILIQQLSFTAENSWVWRASTLYLTSHLMTARDILWNLKHSVNYIISTIHSTESCKVQNLLCYWYSNAVQVFFPGKPCASEINCALFLLCGLHFQNRPIGPKNCKQNCESLCL